jgi:hypothetical protein
MIWSKQSIYIMYQSHFSRLQFNRIFYYLHSLSVHWLKRQIQRWFALKLPRPSTHSILVEGLVKFNRQLLCLSLLSTNLDSFTVSSVLSYISSSALSSRRTYSIKLHIIKKIEYIINNITVHRLLLFLFF